MQTKRGGDYAWLPAIGAFLFVGAMTSGTSFRWAGGIAHAPDLGPLGWLLALGAALIVLAVSKT